MLFKSLNFHCKTLCDVADGAEKQKAVAQRFKCGPEVGCHEPQSKDRKERGETSGTAV